MFNLLENLIKWENEKDIDKIHQFLMSNWEKKDKPLISYAINVLDKIHAPESLKYIITLNQDLFSKELSFQIRDVLINWGDPVIECLYEHITCSNDKFNAVKAFYTLGKIADERIISKILVIIYKNINSLEKDACKILQKKMPFSKLVETYKNSNEYIRFALIKAASSYPFDSDTPEFPIPSTYYAFFEEEIWYEDDIHTAGKDNKQRNEELKKEEIEGENFSTPKDLFDFFSLALEDKHVQVRYAGIQGLRTEIENAKSEWFWRNESQVFPFVRKILLHSIHDEDHYIQQFSIEMLKNFDNDEEIYINLKKLIKQKDPLIFEQLISTISEFKKEEMFEDFLEIYKNESYDQNIRSAALSAIAKIPNNKSAEFLLGQGITGITEKYLLEIIESIGSQSAQESYDFLLPFLISGNMDQKLATLKSIAQQNDQLWKDQILIFLRKNDNPIYLYPIIEYLKTFCFEQAVKIIINNIVNTRIKIEITDYLVILQRFIGDESIRTHVSKIDVKNDGEYENEIIKFLTILDSRKNSENVKKT